MKTAIMKAVGNGSLFWFEWRHSTYIHTITYSTSCHIWLQGNAGECKKNFKSMRNTYICSFAVHPYNEFRLYMIHMYVRSLTKKLTILD